MQQTILRSALKASSRPAYLRPALRTTLRSRGLASAAEAANTTKHHSSMVPVEVYPLLAIITSALSFGGYVGYTHLRYDGTVNVVNHKGEVETKHL